GRISDGVYFLTQTVTSPSTRALIARFLGRFKDSAHVEYDPVSYSGILDAHERTFWAGGLPRYRFDQAEVLVSFRAGFLGTWISPVEFTKAYASGRALEGRRLSRHIQLEGRLSITGSNADLRIPVTPGECWRALASIALRLARKARDGTLEWKEGRAGAE